jgi:hypothetical protein
MNNSEIILMVIISIAIGFFFKSNLIEGQKKTGKAAYNYLIDQSYYDLNKLGYNQVSKDIKNVLRKPKVCSPALFHDMPEGDHDFMALALECVGCDKSGGTQYLNDRGGFGGCYTQNSKCWPAPGYTTGGYPEHDCPRDDCEIELNNLCGDERDLEGSAGCMHCAGQNQQETRDSGCTQAKMQTYCDRNQRKSPPPSS